MNTNLGHSGPEWRRQRNASGVLMADNTYGVGTLWSPGVFPFVLEDRLAASAWFDFVFLSVSSGV